VLAVVKRCNILAIKIEEKSSAIGYAHNCGMSQLSELE
jgi:hypothetical protein